MLNVELLGKKTKRKTKEKVYECGDEGRHASGISVTKGDSEERRRQRDEGSTVATPALNGTANTSLHFTRVLWKQQRRKRIT